MITATEMKVSQLTVLIREFISCVEKYSIYETNSEKKISFDWKSVKTQIGNEMEEASAATYKKEIIDIEEMKHTIEK